MTKEELEKEAEKKYCNGCKWRIEQCLWAWRKTNGLKEPNEKNCSCKEVPAYLAGAESREKQIAELEESNKEWQRTCEAKSDTNSQLIEQLADLEEKLANADYQLEGRDNEIRELKEKIEKMKSDITEEIGFAKNFDELHTYSVLNNLLNRWEIKEK